MARSDTRYAQTALKMDLAFLKLLNEKDFEFITVKEICLAAGVNRSTFYLHYETVGDLLEEALEYIGRKFSSYFSEASIDIGQIHALPLDELYLITPKYLVPWLTFTKENRRLFQTVLKRQHTFRVQGAYTEIFRYVIAPILSRYHVAPENQEYIFLFYVEGILAIVKQWIREDCRRDVDEIALLITECVKTGNE